MARPTARWRSSSPSGRRTEGRPVREERRAAPPAARSRSRAIVSGSPQCRDRALTRPRTPRHLVQRLAKANSGQMLD
jgi:hypothetical protein